MTTDVSAGRQVAQDVRDRLEPRQAELVELFGPFGMLTTTRVGSA